MNPLQALRLAAAVEAVSLTVLLGNLVTVHLEAVASLTGPVHGGAYLGTIAARLLLPGAGRPVKLFALIPGFGGVLALRRLHRDRAAAPAPH